MSFMYFKIEVQDPTGQPVYTGYIKETADWFVLQQQLVQSRKEHPELKIGAIVNSPNLQAITVTIGDIVFRALIADFIINSRGSVFYYDNEESKKVKEWDKKQHKAEEASKSSAPKKSKRSFREDLEKLLGGTVIPKEEGKEKEKEKESKIKVLDENSKEVFTGYLEDEKEYNSILECFNEDKTNPENGIKFVSCVSPAFTRISISSPAYREAVARILTHEGRVAYPKAKKVNLPDQALSGNADHINLLLECELSLYGVRVNYPNDDIAIDVYATADLIDKMYKAVGDEKREVYADEDNKNIFVTSSLSMSQIRDAALVLERTGVPDVRFEDIPVYADWEKYEALAQAKAEEAAEADLVPVDITGITEKDWEEILQMFWDNEVKEDPLADHMFDVVKGIIKTKGDNAAHAFAEELGSNEDLSYLPERNLLDLSFVLDEESKGYRVLAIFLSGDFAVEVDTHHNFVRAGKGEQMCLLPITRDIGEKVEKAFEAEFLNVLENKLERFDTPYLIRRVGENETQGVSCPAKKGSTKP